MRLLRIILFVWWLYLVWSPHFNFWCKLKLKQVNKQSCDMCRMISWYLGSVSRVSSFVPKARKTQILSSSYPFWKDAFHWKEWENFILLNILRNHFWVPFDRNFKKLRAKNSKKLNWIMRGDHYSLVEKRTKILTGTWYQSMLLGCSNLIIHSKVLK